MDSDKKHLRGFHFHQFFSIIRLQSNRAYVSIMFGIQKEHSMQLEVGSETYQFRLVPGPLKQGRKRCGSLCDHARREILVSATVPPEVRLEVAALAISEAWQRQTVRRPPMRFVGDVG